MFKPSEKDFDVLFNGTEEKLKEFNEQYFDIIEEFDLNEILDKFKERSINDRIKAAFIVIFGISIFKEEKKEEILRKFSGVICDDDLGEKYDKYEANSSFDDSYSIVKKVNELIKNNFKVREFRFKLKEDHKDFFVLDNSTWDYASKKYKKGMFEFLDKV